MTRSGCRSSLRGSRVTTDRSAGREAAAGEAGQPDSPAGGSRPPLLRPNRLVVSPTRVRRARFSTRWRARSRRPSRRGRWGIGGGGSFVAGDRAEWERTFGVCWHGVYYCARAFLPLLVASPEGVIVNTIGTSIVENRRDASRGDRRVPRLSEGERSRRRRLERRSGPSGDAPGPGGPSEAAHRCPRRPPPRSSSRACALAGGGSSFATTLTPSTGSCGTTPREPTSRASCASCDARATSARL